MNSKNINNTKHTKEVGPTKFSDNSNTDKPLEDKLIKSNLKNIEFNLTMFKILTIIICLFIIMVNYPKVNLDENDNRINIPSNNEIDKTLTNIGNNETKIGGVNHETINENKNNKTTMNNINNDTTINPNQKKEKEKEENKENKEELEQNTPKENYININNNTNNKGFLNIKTYHKGKYTNYNYTDNIKVYKDLYSDISYTPITESNFIIQSVQYSNEDYFKICDGKKLLDETRYKRNPNPKITAIVAYYNRNKFNLYMSLRSIQNQSLKDIEIIYVDDGSTQNKIDELKEEMKYDNRIILLTHKNNKGTLMSRVDGVRYASGEYIILLDQDDMYYDNLVFEKLYKKAKELNADLVQFQTLQYQNSNKKSILGIYTPKSVLITQPELKTAFMNRLGENRLGNCATRMIWDKFIRRKVYLESIEDLGDEYLNHRVFLYEDTIMMFEFSQIAHSYFFYEMIGIRFNTYLQGKSRDSTSQNIRIIAMNQLLFIKLLLYKIDPKYDRFHIFKEWGFSRCSAEVMYLTRDHIDLLQEVIEVIDALEKKYNNTAKELLECVIKIKKKFAIP